jgi:hypothetical protein
MNNLDMNNLKNYNYKHFELDKLLNIIKSFNGNIFGEIIRDYYINVKLLGNCINNNEIYFENINIIFQNNTIIKFFIRILSQNYEIYKEINKINYDVNFRFDTYNLIYNYIIDNVYKSKILKLNIFSNNTDNFQKKK